MTWIDKLERRFGRYGIPRLMVFLTGIMLAGVRRRPGAGRADSAHAHL